MRCPRREPVDAFIVRYSWTSPYFGDMYQAVADSIFKSARMPRMEGSGE